MTGNDLKEPSAEWRAFFRMVRDRFPYSRMREVRVSKGVVAAFQSVECTLNLGRGAGSEERLLPKDLDETWARLIELCSEKNDCILREIVFKDGKPLLVRMKHAGEAIRT